MNNLVGMCQMQMAISDGFLMLTMTYADGPERDYDLAHKLLHPAHYQGAVKRWRESLVWRKRVAGEYRAKRRDKRRREAVTELKYLGAGEYGERRGRAHFHGVFFWKGQEPWGWWSDAARTDWQVGPYPVERRFWVPWWPHGHVHRKFSHDLKRAVRYVAKYAAKGLYSDSSTRETWLTRSNRPILGADAFRALGRSRADLVSFPTMTGKYVPGAEMEGYAYSAKGAALRLIFEGFMEVVGLTEFADLVPDAPELMLPAVKKFRREQLEKRLRDEVAEKAVQLERRMAFADELRGRSNWETHNREVWRAYAELIRVEETGLSRQGPAGAVYARMRAFVVPGLEFPEFKEARGPPVRALERRRVLRAADRGHLQHLKDIAAKHARLSGAGHAVGRVGARRSMSDALGVCPSLERGLPVPAAL